MSAKYKPDLTPRLFQLYGELMRELAKLQKRQDPACSRICRKTHRKLTGKRACPGKAEKLCADAYAVE